MQVLVVTWWTLCVSILFGAARSRWHPVGVCMLAIVATADIASPASAQPAASSAPSGSPPAAPAPSPNDARLAAVASSVGWRRLLLFDDDEGGSSQVDGEAFFLSPSGRDDPRSELVATLAAFRLPARAGHEDAHALCRFPARALFLEGALGFEQSLVAPPRRCPAADAFRRETDAQAVALVYAANDIASPPSAFGHIFLRLQSGEQQRPHDSTDALDHGVDYTATTDTRNPIVYAFKGFAKMFAGRFRVSSYETMLREYATVAARDVWEYQLALRPDEVRLLLTHLWELSNARIDYGYSGENCAYRLIAMVDAAAPRLHLVDALGPVVMPVDIVRAVYAEPGLVRSVAFRPSVRSAARIALGLLDDGEREVVDSLLDDPDAPLPRTVRGVRALVVLDASMRVLEARRTRGMLEGDDRAALTMKDRLATRRDALALSDAWASSYVAPPPDITGLSPHLAHGPVRISMGSGATSQFGSAFGTLGARLALHDLADPPAGEPELTQVQLLDTRVRYDWGRRKLTLDSLTFAELMTLAPLTRFDERPSWRARAFGVRLHDEGCYDCFAHGLDGSVGIATGTDDDAFVAFLMADAYVAFASDLDGIDGSFVRVGLGPFGGLRARLASSTVAVVSGNWSWLPGQHPGQTFDLRASLRTAFTTDLAMGIEAASQPRSLEAQIATYLYF